MILNNTKRRRANFQPLQLEKLLYIEDLIPLENKSTEEDENSGTVVISYFSDD